MTIDDNVKEEKAASDGEYYPNKPPKEKSSKPWKLDSEDESEETSRQKKETAPFMYIKDLLMKSSNF